MSRFTLRQASVDDSEAMSLLANSLLNYMVPNGEAPAALVESLAPKAFAQRLQPGLVYHSWLAEQSGELLGFLSMKGESYLYHLFVSEVFHRQGVARLLWQKMLSERGATEIHLRSSVYAVPFYLRLGFVRTGPEIEMNSLRFQPMLWSGENTDET